MRKQLFYLLATVAVALTMTGCSDDDDPTVLTMEFTPKQIAAVDMDGDTLTVVLTASTEWTASTTTEGVSITPATGKACTGQEISIIIPATQASSRVIEVKLALTDHEFVIDPLYISQEGHSITYEGETYAIARLDDGNVWMCENLRYIPAGMTPSSDPADENGLWYPATNAEKTANPELVSEKGYLYNANTAFGVTVTESNAMELEGSQGICPDGWHLPTVSEMTGLVGQCSNGSLTNPNGAYFDSTITGASIDSLNTDGFNWTFVGYVNYGTTPTFVGAYQTTLYNDTYGALSYIFGSSCYQVKKTDDVVTNIQFYAIQSLYNANNKKVSVAYSNFRSGYSVRCVKNKE